MNLEFSRPAVSEVTVEPAPLAPVIRGRCIVVMGVSACGKTSIAKGVREMIPAWTFADADPFHPPENWAKIVAGIKLSDEERAVFVANLAEFVERQRTIGANLILSWSALKLEHRDLLRSIVPDARFVFLEIDCETALARSLARKAKNADEPGPGIVRGQFDALEVPSHDEALHLPATEPVVVNTFRVIRTYVADGFIVPEEVGIGRR